LLDGLGVPYRYRDYRKEPLSVAELKALLAALDVPARDLLRKNDRNFGALGLSGSEPDAVLLPLMAQHPTLLARPIGWREGRAVVGRPVERLLDLVEAR
jgi:arsenate reductase